MPYSLALGRRCFTAAFKRIGMAARSTPSTGTHRIQPSTEVLCTSSVTSRGPTASSRTISRSESSVSTWLAASVRHGASLTCRFCTVSSTTPMSGTCRAGRLTRTIGNKATRALRYSKMRP